MTEQMVKILGYMGTLCFLVMPYTLQFSYGMFLFFAVSGNVLLLPQVYKAKQWNLVALNIIGGAGYIINVFTNLIN
jgi:hypothetical protein